MVVSSWDRINYEQLNYNERWLEPTNTSFMQMHSLHAYPAKFPAFLASAALDYALSEGVALDTVADIFCGCGTTALEAKRIGSKFWGCDINPVATLITRVKIADYDDRMLKRYYDSIALRWSKLHPRTKDHYLRADERLKYWFDANTYNDLFDLYEIIENVTENDIRYTEAFRCLFSAILKNCSMWLQKSIKPQFDPNKKSRNVFKLFTEKFCQFEKAVQEVNKRGFVSRNDITIVQENFLDVRNAPDVNLIISSPPYVTSYEYADLHQLSSLWLGYAEDYRDLRCGSIGSIYSSSNWDIDEADLNQAAKDIVGKLKERDCQPAKIKAIARYYSEMQIAIKKCADMLVSGGMAIFVIGDSEMKKVELKNSKHLIESMMDVGFGDIKIEKRRVSKGICIPYRDEHGRFSKTKETKNTIYHEEYVVSGRMA